MNVTVLPDAVDNRLEPVNRLMLFAAGVAVPTSAVKVVGIAGEFWMMLTRPSWLIYFCSRIFNCAKAISTLFSNKVNFMEWAFIFAVAVLVSLLTGSTD